MVVCSSCAENPDGFRFCGACGAALGAQPKRPREVRRSVTTFCDLLGSTALGVHLDPEALRQLQTRYFEHARAVVECHEGTVEKFIGDAGMAVFGIAPDPRGRRPPGAQGPGGAPGRRHRPRLSGADRVTRARWSRDWATALATGDAVNTAARLEQAAPYGEILLGEPTLRLCRDVVEERADSAHDGLRAGATKQQNEHPTLSLCEIAGRPGRF